MKSPSAMRKLFVSVAGVVVLKRSFSFPLSVMVTVISVNPDLKSCVIGQTLNLFLGPYLLREESEHGLEPERKASASLFAS